MKKLLAETAVERDTSRGCQFKIQPTSGRPAQTFQRASASLTIRSITFIRSKSTPTAMTL
jgi:hypothetical protein